MKVLTVDVGTGTQDILLYDSEKTIENSFKLVMPSPTMIIATRVHEATRRGDRLVLNGVMMVGGPCAWAVRDHAKAGFPVYATPAAARTLDDDLSRVEAMGIKLVSEDEAQTLGRKQHTEILTFGDFNFGPIAASFQNFGLTLKPDALAIAVFDHGAAPPEISDRTFRFEFIADTLRQDNNLAAFAFNSDQIPARLTRFEAVEQSASQQLPGVPLTLMDTGPAAALGALEDLRVREAVQSGAALVVNIGNFHTLAFLFKAGQIVGTFEHHTGELKPAQLENFLTSLADGSLTNAEIFNSQGHGAVFLQTPETITPQMLAVIGPRRKFLANRPLTFGNQKLQPLLAVPHGDMMLSGNFGLLRALAYRRPDLPLNLAQTLNADLSLEF